MTDEMQNLLSKRAVLYEHVEKLRKEEREYRERILKHMEDIRKQLNSIDLKLKEVCTHKNEDGKSQITNLAPDLRYETKLLCSICGKVKV